MGKKTDLDSVHSLNHARCMISAFQNFRQDETMLDVTLVCNGQSLKAHKLILASCSQYFKKLFSENPCKHPIVIMRHFDFDDLKAIIDFIYKGELLIPRERLTSALEIAEEFNIRGLISSGTNKENYKKLYNQIYGKLPNRKKRKRHRHNSTDSGGNNYIKLSDSDQNIELNADNVTFSDPQVRDTESVCAEENLVNERKNRPHVLHVGDLSTSNEESIPKDQMDEEDSNEVSLDGKKISADDLSIEISSVPKEDIEAKIYEAATENIELSSQFDGYAAYSESSNLEYVPEGEQNNSQDQSMKSIPASEDLKKQTVFMSSLSPKSSEVQQYETRPPKEGKRFICSKCDSIFTSRINFMRHKAVGHSNMDKSPRKCQYCTFTTEDIDCLKHHLLTHTDSVPYKCSTCSEEFTSEDVYQKHISIHEVEEITLHGFSAVAGQDLFSTQHANSAKNLEFRCSICFVKFSSKLRCQIHEKSCEGGS